MKSTNGLKVGDKVRTRRFDSEEYKPVIVGILKNIDLNVMAIENENLLRVSYLPSNDYLMHVDWIEKISPKKKLLLKDML